MLFSCGDKISRALYNSLRCRIWRYHRASMGPRLEQDDYIVNDEVVNVVFFDDAIYYSGSNAEHIVFAKNTGMNQHDVSVPLANVRSKHNCRRARNAAEDLLAVDLQDLLTLDT